jgi:hypothetical protein
MTEEEPLPLARMATINRPTFWIFLGVCILLYIINKFLTPDTSDRSAYGLNDILIMSAAFVGLLLNLLTMYVKKEALSRKLNIACYIFEVAGIVLLMFMVFTA